MIFLFVYFERVMSESLQQEVHLPGTRPVIVGLYNKVEGFFLRDVRLSAETAELSLPLFLQTAPGYMLRHI